MPDRGAISLQLLAAMVAVVIAITGLIAVDLPGRLGCEVDSAVTSVTDADTASDRCEDPAVTPDLAAAEAASATGGGADPFRGTGKGEAGRLRARALAATDSVASPAIRGPALPAGYTRCAPAPDDPATAARPGTAICLGGADLGPDGNAFTGSDLILRCAAATSRSTDTCGLTDDDPSATLRSGPRDGDVRFCQPVTVERTDPRAGTSPFTVDWACASWAGNLYHCTNTLPAGIITSARSDTLVNYTEPTTWVTDPDYRQHWPRTCTSRTFGPTDLACTPNQAGNTAACSIRGFQGLPPRPATCVYFHPIAGEDPSRSHTLDKPMHCRLTTPTPAGPSPRSTSAPGPTSGSTTAAPVSAHLAVPCPALRGRRIQAGTSVAQVVCARPQRVTGQPVQTWTAAADLSALPAASLSASTVEAVPIGPGDAAAPITATQPTVLQQLTDAGLTQGFVPTTIVHDGPPVWLVLDLPDDPAHHVLLVPSGGTPQQLHTPFAQWLLFRLGITPASPMYSTLLALVIEQLIAVDTGTLVPPAATVDYPLTAEELLTHATHLAAQVSSPLLGTAGGLLFAAYVATAITQSPAGVPDVIAAFQGAAQATAQAAQLAGGVDWYFLVTEQLTPSLAALLAMGTPLSAAEAETAMGMTDPDGPPSLGYDGDSNSETASDFWEPVPVSDIPEAEQAPIHTEGFVLVENPDGQICLGLLPTLCGNP